MPCVVEKEFRVGVLVACVKFLKQVTNYVDSDYSVDVLYSDFQKAFNKVFHKRLLLKIKAHGICGNIAT